MNISRVDWFSMYVGYYYHCFTDGKRHEAIKRRLINLLLSNSKAC